MREFILSALMLMPACGAREAEPADVIVQRSVEPLVDPVVQLGNVVPPASARPAEAVAITPERAELERAARALGGRLSADGVIEPPLQDELPLLAGSTARPATPAQATDPQPDNQAAPVVAEPEVSLPEATQSEPEAPVAAVAEPGEQPVVEPPVQVQAQVPWLQQYQAAYAARTIALSDVTTQLSNPTLGVYVEDYRTSGAAAGTPHMTWLSGSELQVVSPALESLLISQGVALPAPSPFNCDASTYACRSVENGAQGVYFRFAVVGEPQVVRLVGVLYYDTTERTAAINTRVEAFNRVIDAQLKR